MANTVGPLIKEARSKAKLSQEALAAQIEGLSAADLGKAERGEKELSQAVLRSIAKITGVTQSSLINAAKESSNSPAKKTSDTGEKKTAATGAKKTGTAGAKTGASSGAKKKEASASENAVKLSAAEKKLIELYRAADAETKKKAVAVLKGEQGDTGDILTALLGSAIDMFGKK